MKKILLQIMVLLLIVQSTFSQFRAFSSAAGFAYSHGAAITHVAHFSLAGGGVVLKGVARPKDKAYIPEFTAISFTGVNGLSTMHIQARGLSLSYSDKSWLMRDAAMLVRSEGADIYRDVNLLGEYTDDEIYNGSAKEHPRGEYFNVEMTPSLVGTQGGQTLLYMDIMLAGTDNTYYYSHNRLAAEIYQDSMDSLRNSVIHSPYNDSIDGANRNLYDKLKQLDSLRNTRALDSLEKVSARHILDSLRSLPYKDSWGDYTYNDENADYRFYYTQNDKRLHVDGTPSYTFLIHKHTLFSDSMTIDSVCTNYFVQNPDLIKNLNYSVVNDAEHFSKVAAFYRYLKSDYPRLWNQVYVHYLHTVKKTGKTPRFIKITPPDDNQSSER